MGPTYFLPSEHSLLFITYWDEFHVVNSIVSRQHDDERRRGAQEIQRGLQECEIRLDEIKTLGQTVELKLLEGMILFLT